MCNIDGINTVLNIIKTSSIEYKVLFIGFNATLYILNKREKSRNEIVSRWNNRSEGIAAYQQPFVNDINKKFAHFNIHVDGKTKEVISHMVVEKINEPGSFVDISQFKQSMEKNNEPEQHIGFGNKDKSINE